MIPARLAAGGLLTVELVDDSDDLMIISRSAVIEQIGRHFHFVAHAGAHCDTNFTNCQGEIIDWANRVTARPDLIVAGHSHQVVQTVVNRIPIIEAGSYGGRWAAARAQVGEAA